MGTTLNLHQLLPLLLLLLLLLNLAIFPSHSQSITHNYASFNASNRDDFFFSSQSGVTQGALQITPDSSNTPAYHINKSGRVLLNQSFNLWQQHNSTSNLVASFNTSFSVNVFHLQNITPAEGIAFVIAPSRDEPPENSYGGFLGLTNATLDGNPSNHIVAIELDTSKQNFDPDNNHIGLDLNSVKSNRTASLKPLGIEIAPVTAANYTVWIDYNGDKKHIWVYIARQHNAKPTVPVIESPLDLSKYILQDSYFGFTGSTGTDYELNCVLEWDLSVQQLPASNGNRGGTTKWKVAVAVALPLVALLGIVTGLLYMYVIKRKKVGDHDPSLLAGTLKSLPGMPKEFDFKVLKKATNNFDDERMKLGQGGFGIVYKGVIPGEETEVAVKKFSRDNMKGQDDFLSELRIINMLRHKHLVKLLGWCHHNGLLLLVYEYMPNGSLDHHLFGGPDRPNLTWSHRYTILNGVASALHYLHNEYEQKVIHRDLKASNVLLDSNFNARLGDFGLARAIDTDKTSYVDVELGGVQGTMGYIAPECFHTGKATRESDVFGFGAVVLEVVCGKRPRIDISGFQFLADWVWKLHREERILDAVDTRLDGEFDKEDAVRLLLLGLACSHPTPKERPKTAAIVQILSRSVAPPVVPPFKPAFVWPSGSIEDEEEGEDCSMTSTLVTSGFYESSGWTARDTNSNTYELSNM